MKSLIKSLPLALIVFIAFSLRLINLGHSDYQGDEVKSLYMLEQGQTQLQFFMDQRKGPGQFLVTSLMGYLTPDYSNEFIVRFPFALAGALAVYLFYLLLNMHFGQRIAFYASFFMATNGLFVGLTRISQYQAFVIYFSVLSLLCFSHLLDKGNTKYLYYGAFSWVLAIMFHYDAVFIAPFAFFLVFSWLKLNFKKRVTHIIYSGLLSAIFLSIFYIPFVLSLSESTLTYWSGRITGAVATKISSSKYLFSVYQPIYVTHVYTALSLIGIFVILYNFFIYALKRFNLGKKLQLFLGKFDFLIHQKSLSATFYLFLWFLIGILFFEVFVYIPGTHIFNYLIPLFVIMAFGITFIERVMLMFKNLFYPEVIMLFGISIIFTFIYLQSYAIFVDHTYEYPWENEKFFVWEFFKPTPTYHLSMFGFPYYRNWEGIRDFIQDSGNNGYYSTNERDSISRFYIHLKKDTNLSGYYIHVMSPQTFTDENIHEKALYWAGRYKPVYTYSKDGRDLVRVYNMAQGGIDEIISLGY